MSANTEVRSSKLFGRSVLIAAGAGLVGVVISIVAAVMLLVGPVAPPAQVPVQPAALEPGYLDYGLRHPRTEWALEPGYLDYGLRHPRTEWAVDPGYLDYGQRHPQPPTDGDK